MGSELALRGRAPPYLLDRLPCRCCRTGGRMVNAPFRSHRRRRRRSPRDPGPMLAAQDVLPGPRLAALDRSRPRGVRRVVRAGTSRSPRPCRAPGGRGTAPASSTTCCPGAQDGGGVGGHPGPFDLSPPRPAGDPGPTRRRGRHLPDLAAIVCLVGPMPIEQRDAWAVSHCHPRVQALLSVPRMPGLTRRRTRVGQRCRHRWMTWVVRLCTI